MAEENELSSIVSIHGEQRKEASIAPIHDKESNYDELVDYATERALVRKLDMRIVPMMMLMYLMSFMDRVNIGNARLYGLEEDLGMTGNQYQLSVSILFVTYCLFETPSNLILKKIRPARYLTSLVVFWGLVATFSGFAQSYGSFIVCRLLLGLFEAGLFPGLVVYLTMFYTRRDIALRTALLLSTAAFAGAIGGLLAYAIGHMDGVQGYRAWRWIVILEGIPTVLLGALVIWILPDSPETASFLTDVDRRNLAHLKMREVGHTAGSNEFHRSDLKAAAKDWKIYIMAVSHYCTNLMFYSFSIFLPTILRELGTWKVVEVQALTIPVYATGAFVYISVAILSDRIQQRGIFAASFMLFCILGYALLLANINVSSRFAATFLVAIGCYTVVGIPITWVVSNQPRYAKRAFANGVQITVGNSAGIAAPFLYSSTQAPHYRRGYSATIGLLILSMSIYTVMHLYYKHQNTLREAGRQDWKTQGKTEAEINEMGEQNPRYRFTV